MERGTYTCARFGGITLTVLRRAAHLRGRRKSALGGTALAAQWIAYRAGSKFAGGRVTASGV